MGDDQKGSVATVDTEFSMDACRLFLKMLGDGAKSAAALFVDVKGAFYSVLLELAVGACMQYETKVAAFCGARMSLQVAEQLSLVVVFTVPFLC